MAEILINFILIAGTVLLFFTIYFFIKEYSKQ